MWRGLFLLSGVLILLLPAPASAHGITVDYTAAPATVVEVRASFDAGEPMAAAQVIVYTPDDPSTPWLTGVTDEAGLFRFTPDPNKPGRWEVVVRQAGHGDTIYIPVDENAASQPDAFAALPSSGSSSYTPLQLVVMGACVIWGFVGTALYFSRRG